MTPTRIGVPCALHVDEVFYARFVADVAGIETYLVKAYLAASYREFTVELYIRDERHAEHADKRLARLDLSIARYSYPRDIAARRRKRA